MIEILCFVENMAAARAEISSVGGRILHVLTPSVLVAAIPDGVALDTCTTRRPSDLDPASARIVDAWLTSKTKPTPTESIPWDHPGFEAPD